MLSSTYAEDLLKTMRELVQPEAMEYVAIAWSFGIGIYSGGYLRWPSIILSLLSLHYLVLYLMYHFGQQRKGVAKVPPMVPYAVPVVGSIVKFLWDPWSFVCEATYHAGKHTVSGIKLMGRDFYLLQGKENIQGVWKSASLSSPTFMRNYTRETFFGMPRKSVEFYDKDDTGTAAKTNGFNSRIHSLLAELLLGPGLAPLFDRFQANLGSMVQSLRAQKGWTTKSDLFALLQQDLTPCVIKSICGPTLAENPEFINTFWQYDSWIPVLSKRVPRIIAPKPYIYRDRLLVDIKKWHAKARQGFRSEDESLDYEPLWGSKVMRQKQAMFRSDDYDAMAAADLGMIWVTISNVIPATFWTVFEIFKDQQLLARVRTEVLECIEDTSEGERVNVHKLLERPLLQSVYTEVLRLRTHLFITRGSNHSSSIVGNWIFPRGKAVLIPTTPSHLDPEGWYTGQNDDHPVDTFWADRFLVASEDGVKFSTERSNGLMFPYGGGPRICPGRQFAKREIIFTAAQLAHNFDILIEPVHSNPKMIRNYFGLGVLGPADQVPFQIRPRSRETCKGE